MIFFNEEVSFSCDLQGKSLNDIFSQWKSNDFKVKKHINDNHIIVRKKYVHTLGDALIAVAFDNNKDFSCSYYLYFIYYYSFIIHCYTQWELHGFLLPFGSFGFSFILIIGFQIESSIKQASVFGSVKVAPAKERYSI